MLDLGKSLVAALLILPASLVGVCIAAWVYQEHVEHWLNKHFKTKKNEERGE